jgi:hypothetical protein
MAKIHSWETEEKVEREMKSVEERERRRPTEIQEGDPERAGYRCGDREKERKREREGNKGVDRGVIQKKRHREWKS